MGPQRRTRAGAAGSMQTTLADFSRFVEGVMQGKGPRHPDASGDVQATSHDSVAKTISDAVHRHDTYTPFEWEGYVPYTERPSLPPP